MRSFIGIRHKALLIIILVIFTASSLLAGCNKEDKATLTEIPPEASGDQLVEALKQEQVLQEAEKENLLKSYTFYTGVANVLEDQTWKSKSQDGTYGVGNATLSSVDYLVYDPQTEQCYILARDMTYSSSHTVTVNDMQGTYISTGYVSGSGELNEYYGTGLITKKETTDASASEKPAYTLNFSTNPVRIDARNNLVMTLPPTRNSQWVAYISTADTVRLGIERVLPPDGAPNEKVHLMPDLNEISEIKTYGNKEARIYEATTRIWNVKGTFSYTYKKIGYEEAMKAIHQIELAELEKALYDALAQNLPEPWQGTARVADHLDNIVDASQSASSLLQTLDTSASGANVTLEQAVDITTLDPDFQNAVRRIKLNIDEAQADQGSLRKLDGAVLGASAEDNSGAEQKKIRESYGEVKLILAGIFKEYDDIYSQMLLSLEALKIYVPQGNTMDTQKAAALLDDCRLQSEKAALVNQKVRVMLEDLYAVLSELKTGKTVSKENAYASLNHLYSVWPETLKAFSAGGVSIDLEQGVALPAGYPADLVPIIEGAVLAISERLPGGSNIPDGYMLTLKSDRSVQEAEGYYQNALKKIDDLETFTMSGMVILSGTKDPYTISVMISPNSLGGPEITMIQIVLSAE